MEEVLDKNIEAIEVTARKLVELGWAESFFGNISVLMDPIEDDLEVIDRFPSPVEVTELNGLDLLVTRTTSTMEEVANSPVDSIGLYRINGSELELLWGSGPPTSELSSHLMAYSSGRGQAIVHCHMEDVSRAGPSLSKENTHREGFGIVHELDPGSIELAEATRDSLHSHDTIIWKNHGAFSMSDGLERCLERLVTLETFLKTLLN